MRMGLHAVLQQSHMAGEAVGTTRPLNYLGRTFRARLTWTLAESKAKGRTQRDGVTRGGQAQEASLRQVGWHMRDGVGDM